jgi:hypothetical protein
MLNKLFHISLAAVLFGLAGCLAPQGDTNGSGGPQNADHQRETQTGTGLPGYYLKGRNLMVVSNTSVGDSGRISVAVVGQTDSIALLNLPLPTPMGLVKGLVQIEAKVAFWLLDAGDLNRAVGPNGTVSVNSAPLARTEAHSDGSFDRTEFDVELDSVDSKYLIFYADSRAKIESLGNSATFAVSTTGGTGLTDPASMIAAKVEIKSDGTVVQPVGLLTDTGGVTD